MTDPAATPHERPSLVPEPSKPDVLVRLRELGEWAEDSLDDESNAAINDAIDAITGLRASNETRLQLINEAKGERDEARARCATAFNEGAEAMRAAAVKACEATAKVFEDKGHVGIAASYTAQAQMLALLPLPEPPAALPAPQPAESQS
jgi:hypothetical protein